MESCSGAKQQHSAVAKQCHYFAKERALYKIMLSAMPQALSHFQCAQKKTTFEFE